MSSCFIPGKFPGIILVDDLEDYAVLFHPATAETMGLNSSALLIWRLIDGKRCLEEIAEEIGAVFSIRPGQATADVKTVTERLYRRMFIRFAGGSVK